MVVLSCSVGFIERECSFCQGGLSWSSSVVVEQQVRDLHLLLITAGLTVGGAGISFGFLKAFFIFETRLTFGVASGNLYRLTFGVSTVVLTTGSLTFFGILASNSLKAFINAPLRSCVLSFFIPCCICGKICS